MGESRVDALGIAGSLGFHDAHRDAVLKLAGAHVDSALMERMLTLVDLDRAIKERVETSAAEQCLHVFRLHGQFVLTRLEGSLISARRISAVGAGLCWSAVGSGRAAAETVIAGVLAESWKKLCEQPTLVDLATFARELISQVAAIDKSIGKDADVWRLDEADWRAL